MTNKNQLPESVEVKLFIHAPIYEGGDMCITPSDMTEYGYVLMGEHSVTVPIPQDVDLVQAEIESLEKVADGIRAEFHAKLTQVNDRIQSLKAIEHKHE